MRRTAGSLAARLFFPQQLRQLGDVRRDPLRLIFGQEFRRQSGLRRLPQKRGSALRPTRAVASHVTA